ncbi:hypothetical protein [Microvirga calopogonii]|nr:hypothetical protein [Microvirga calopogonii]
MHHVITGPVPVISLPYSARPFGIEMTEHALGHDMRGVVLDDNS